MPHLSLSGSRDQAKDVFKKNREGLDRVAKELVEKEEISGKEVLELVGAEKSKAPMKQDENLESPPSLSAQDDFSLNDPPFRLIRSYFPSIFSINS
jgi:transposase